MRYKLSSRAIGIVALLVVSLSANAQNERLRYGVSFDGKTIDTLFSANGGWPQIAFKTASSGLGYLQKQISDTLSASEVSVQMGASSPAMFDWIKTSFDHSNGFRTFTVVATDPAGNTGQVDCKNALITEVSFPALDAASKDAAKMSIKFKPESTNFSAMYVNPRTISRQQFFFSQSNFRVRVAGIDKQTLRISKVDSIVIRQKNVEHAVGQLRDYEQDAGIIGVTLPAGGSSDFADWLKQTVASVATGVNAEREGSVTYFTDAGLPIGTLLLHGVGIIGVVPADLDGDADPDVKVQMYVQHVEWVPA